MEGHTPSFSHKKFLGQIFKIQERQMNFLRVAAKAGLFIFSTVLTIAIAEFILKNYFPIEVPQSDPGIFWDHMKRSTLAQTKASIKAFNGIDVFDEKLGFISKEVLDAEKTFGTRTGYRIMLLGDSITAKPEFSTAVTDAIRARYPKKALDFFNAGTGGWDSEQEFTYFKERGLSYHPNLVILQFCMNDFAQTPVFLKTEEGEFVGLNLGIFGKVVSASVLQKSQLLQRLLIVYLKYFPFGYRLDSSKVDSAMQKFAALAKAGDFDIHLVIIPFLQPPSTADQERHRLIREIAAKHFRPEQVSDFIDLTVSPQIPGWRLAPTDFTHPNKKMAGIIADEVVKKINIP
jgi:lysophospholipase L1-like esterase